MNNIYCKTCKEKRELFSDGNRGEHALLNLKEAKLATAALAESSEANNAGRKSFLRVVLERLEALEIQQQQKE